MTGSDTPAKERAMSQRYTILIVDDEDDIRGAIRRTLHVPGYTIFEATNPAEALQILRTFDVDAVVSDFNMPGMNGLDFLQRVRLTTPDVVRILLTAQADVQIAMRALNEGAVHRFLLKPWDHKDLRTILSIALHARRAAQPAPTPAAAEME
jgi:DNA-binding NtrC family response regulator